MRVFLSRQKKLLHKKMEASRLRRLVAPPIYPVNVPAQALRKRLCDREVSSSSVKGPLPMLDVAGLELTAQVQR